MMEEEENKLDEIFRNALKDFKEEPPAKVWENIKGALPVNPVSKGIFRKYINTAAAIVVISTLLFTAYHFYHKTISNQQSAISSQNKTQALSNPSDNSSISVHSPQSASNRQLQTYKQQNLNKKSPAIVNNKVIKSENIVANNVSQYVENNQPINNIAVEDITIENKAAVSPRQSAVSSQQSAVNAQETVKAVTPAISITPDFFDILKPSQIKPLLAKYIFSYNNETYPELAVPL